MDKNKLAASIVVFVVLGSFTLLGTRMTAKAAVEVLDQVADAIKK